MVFRAGSLVTVSFPFTDLSAVKRRPAMVLLVHGEDLVVCGVTSRLSGRRDAVRLDSTDLVQGRLPRPSEIRPFKLFTIHRSLVHRIVGRISDEIWDAVVSRIVDTLRSGRVPAPR